MRSLKICWADARFDGPDRLTDGLFKVLRDNGHTVTGHCEKDYDVIINGSCFIKTVKNWSDRFPHIPVVNYVWDWYPWVTKDLQGHPQYELYRSYIRGTTVLTPNTGTSKRLLEDDIESTVVPFSIPAYEEEVRDDRFVLDPVRDYPERNCYWVREACKELGIPCVHTEHGLSQAEFRKLVATCSFITCGYLEASTGGLTLIEGLYLGKPGLVSNSQYMGGTEYLKGWGYYFDCDSYEDLKIKLKELWDNTPKIDVADAREYIKQNLSDEALYERLYPILCDLKRN